MDRLIIVMIFMLAPLDFARNSITNFQYSISNFIFYFAWWLLSMDYKKPAFIIKFISMIMFLMSFQLEVYPIFYFTVISYIFYKEIEQNSENKLATLRRTICNKAIFFLLPGIFFFLRWKYFMPRDIYAGLNTINLNIGNLMRANMKVMNSAYANIYQLIALSIHKLIEAPMMLVTVLLLLVILIAVFIRVLLDDSKDLLEGEGIIHGILYFIVGCMVYYLAVFPFCIVDGKSPAIMEWESRYQIAIPLGFSLMLYFGIRTLSMKIERTLFIAIYSILITAFINYNISIDMGFQKDAFKQISIMSGFKEHSDIFERNNAFVFDDRTQELNAINRVYRFYEYTGMMKEVFKEETRYGVAQNQKSLSLGALEEYTKSPIYNMSNYKKGNIECKVTIRQGPYELTNKNVVKMLYYRLFRKQEYERLVKRIVKIEFQKC